MAANVSTKSPEGVMASLFRDLPTVLKSANADITVVCRNVGIDPATLVDDRTYLTLDQASMLLETSAPLLETGQIPPSHQAQ